MESLLQVIRNAYMHFFSCFGIHVRDSNMNKPTKVEMAIPQKRHLRSEEGGAGENTSPRPNSMPIAQMQGKLLMGLHL